MAEKKAPAKKAPAKKAPAKKAPAKRKVAPRKPRLSAAKLEEIGGPGPRWPWELRPYQQEASAAFDAGRNRQMLIWHRRAGKDIYGISKARDESRHRVGGYVHFFPKHVQAKRAIWRGVDPRSGTRIIDQAFGDIQASRDNQEMFIQLQNGSTWQLLGSDNYDRVVGSNIVGLVFSEWALCDPRAWDYMRPIIRENNGWVLFITTYRGRNHAYQMFQRLKDNENWYCDLRTIRDTTDLDGKPILTDADMDEERREGMSEATIQQEYFCNPAAAAEGAIYGKELEQLLGVQARNEATYDPARPVYAVWNFDLPIFASVMFVQPGEVPRVLAAETFTETSLPEALSAAAARPWPIRQHVIHSRLSDMVGDLRAMNCSPVVVRERPPYQVFARTSRFLQLCQIEAASAPELIESISGFVRREIFEQQTGRAMFSEVPVVSWHSQLVDCLETFCCWDYDSAGTSAWSSELNYEEADRIARVVL